jgi:hypothetical protein
MPDRELSDAGRVHGVAGSGPLARRISGNFELCNLPGLVRLMAV